MSKLVVCSERAGHRRRWFSAESWFHLPYCFVEDVRPCLNAVHQIAVQAPRSPALVITGDYTIADVNDKQVFQELRFLDYGWASPLRSYDVCSKQIHLNRSRTARHISASTRPVPHSVPYRRVPIVANLILLTSWAACVQGSHHNSDHNQGMSRWSSRHPTPTIEMQSVGHLLVQGCKEQVLSDYERRRQGTRQRGGWRNTPRQVTRKPRWMSRDKQ